MKLRVKVHPAGWILFAAMLAYVPASRLVASVLVLCLHEAGHLVLMKLSGVRECSVELTPFGGVADVPGYERLPAGKRALCAAGGVMVSGGLAALCRLPCFSGMFWQDFFGCNLGMTLINLLPIWPLDGARIAVAGAEKIGIEKAVVRITVFLGYLFALGLFLCGIYGLLHGIVNLSLFLLPPYMCYASYQSAVFNRIRCAGSVMERGRLSPGEVRRVTAFASCGQPETLGLMRMQQTVAGKNTPILYICDERTGDITEILTQKQICNKLFSIRP